MMNIKGGGEESDHDKMKTMGHCGEGKARQLQGRHSRALWQEVAM